MKKSYYVDGHEHEDQKRHRSEFTNKYLTQLEARSHRWVQMSTEMAEILKLSLPANDPLLVTGHIMLILILVLITSNSMTTITTACKILPIQRTERLVAMLASARLLTKSLLSSLDKTSQSSINSRSAHRSG